MERTINSFPITFQLHNNLTHTTKTQKSKQNTTTTNRKQQLHPQNSKSNHIFSKSKSHTRQNSHPPKSKSKCDTQINLSNKKKKTQYESISKKTIPKKKKTNVMIKSSFEGIGDSSRPSVTRDARNTRDVRNTRNVQPLHIKSNKKQKMPKQMFHSTCFSGHYDMDGVISPGTSDILLCSGGMYEDKELMMSRVYEKTKCALQQYRQKCNILDKNCKYYQSQLNKALKHIKQLTKTTEYDHKSCMKPTQSVRRANSLNKSRHKNRAKTNTTKGSKYKNSTSKQYGLTFHRNNSEMLV